MNSVNLTGRLTKNPELKSSQGGKPTVAFTIAVKKKYKKDAEPDYIYCRAWEHTAEFIEKYVRQGDLVGVNGRIETYKTEKDGKKLTNIEIVVEDFELLAKKKEDTKEADEGPEAQEAAQEASVADEDDLPF